MKQSTRCLMDGFAYILVGSPFVVIDNGSGVPQKIRDTLFEPFATTKESGMGIGLALVRSIIDAHRGRIQLQKTSADGTTFLLTLPELSALADDS